MRSIGVVGDAAAFVGGGLVLAQMFTGLFEGAAVAEFVFVDVGRDAGEGGEVDIAELGLVFGEGHG